MKIDNRITDKIVLEELGRRIRERRLNEKLSQASLAENAGVGKTTMERLETGKPVDIVNFIRILRALNMLAVLDIALPEMGVRPMDLIKSKPKKRMRVSKEKPIEKAENWSWGNHK